MREEPAANLLERVGVLLKTTFAAFVADLEELRALSVRVRFALLKMTLLTDEDCGVGRLLLPLPLAGVTTTAGITGRGFTVLPLADLSWKK